MCGLHGVYSNFLTDKEINIYETIAMFSNLRGYQGSGAIGVWDDKYTVVKDEKTSLHLMNNSDYREMVKPGHRPKAIIGHCRWPTKGGINLAAVHPHESEHIVGVHNGTMFKVAGEYISNDQSDSKALIQAMSEMEIQDVVDKSNGAYAMVWLDKRNHTMHMLRNAERPLYLAKIGNPKTPETIYWASDQRFLEWAFDYHNVVPARYDIESLQPNIHAVFDLKKKGEISPVEVSEVRKIETFQERGGKFDYTGAYGDWPDNEVDEWGAWAIGGVEGTGAKGTGSSSKGCVWVKLGSSSSPKDDHGAVQNIIYRRGTYPKDDRWTANFSDGAVCEYDYYPHQLNFNYKPKYSTIQVPPHVVNVNTQSATTAGGQGAVIPFQNWLEKRDAQGKEKDTQNGGSKECAADLNNTAHILDEDIDPWEDQEFVESLRDEEALDAFRDAHNKANGRRKWRNNTVVCETLKGHYVTKEEYTDYLNEGCAWCGSNTRSNVIWFEEDQYICDNCSKDDGLREASGLIDPKIFKQ